MAELLTVPRLLRVRTRSYAGLIAGLVLTAGATITILVAVPYALGGGRAAAALFGGVGAGVIGLFLVVDGILLRRWRERELQVAVRDGQVTLDGVPLAGRFSGARVEPAEGRWRVALFTGGRHPVARVHRASQEDADAFVATLSPGAIDDVISFRLPVAGTPAGPIATLLLWMALVAGGLLAFLTKLPLPLAMLVVACGAVLIFVPQRADVGVDGIALIWMGHTTLIPFATIKSMRVERGALFLDIHGRPRPLRVVSAVRGDDSAAGSRDALMARIARHRDTANERLASLNAALSLSRSDRDAWIDHLRRLGRSSYRGLALAPTALWEVVQDPASSEDARIAAATLLRLAMDADGVRRIHRLAASATSPSLRTALETIANDPDPLALRADSASS